VQAFVAALLVLGAIGVIVWLYRKDELFYISVRRGTPLLVRGRIEPRLVNAFGDVLRGAGIESASIRGVRTESHVRLVTRNVDQGTTQRLRNVLGFHPAGRYRSAPIATDRNLGQVLGVAWLAWLLVRR
jgi:hypothetical protein